ncbi:MAG TPA: acyl-CoA dehydrogenase, partial [Leptospiraceae bacterium]|nr:acyl-CoA dehydrogenase [Leptospiraceae bacterium]
MRFWRMIANNYFLDDPDLQTFFNHLIDWDSIVQAVEGNDFADHRRFLETGNSRFEMAPASVEEAVGLYRSSLESLGEFCGKELSQVSQAMDRAALQFQNGRVVFPSETISVYEKFRETGLMPYSISRHAGGLGLPATVG